MSEYPENIVWPLLHPLYKNQNVRYANLNEYSIEKLLSDLAKANFKHDKYNQLRFVLSYKDCYYENDWPEIVICQTKCKLNVSDNTVWPQNNNYEFYDDVYTASIAQILDDLYRLGYSTTDHKYLFFKITYSQNPIITIYDQRIK